MVQIQIMCECGYPLKDAAMNKFGCVQTPPCAVCTHEAYKLGFKAGQEYSVKEQARIKNELKKEGGEHQAETKNR